MQLSRQKNTLEGRSGILVQKIFSKLFTAEWRLQTRALPANVSVLLIPLLLLAGSLFVIRAASRLDHPIDDAYITMTYARSVAEGRGFTFAVSAQPTLGTTTPLNTLLLAALFRLFPSADPASLAVTLSVCFWLATAWLWALRGHTLGLTRLESLAVAILLFLETTLWVSYLGMEARLLTFLLTVCVFLYVEGRFFWTGVALGLLFLTRGDGILMAGVFGLHQLFTLRKGAPFAHVMRRSLLLIGGFALSALPWILYAYFTFGSPLPTTLAAKAVQTRQGFTQPFIVYLGYLFVGDWSSLGFIGGGVSPWALMLLAGVGYAWYARRQPLLLLAWCIAYIVGYALLHIPTYKWYALPAMYVTVIFAALALASPATLLPRYLSAPDARRLGTLAACGCLAWVCLTILPQTLSEQPVRDERHAVYQNLSAWLDDHTPAGSRIAYVEVGVLAWYGQREIVDLMGLTNPELLPDLQQGGVQAAFWRANPNYLICSSRFPWACEDLIASERFTRRYAPVVTLTGRQLGATEFPEATYVVYRRQPAHLTKFAA
jgi:hypothetical protein